MVQVFRSFARGATLDLAVPAIVGVFAYTLV